MGCAASDVYDNENVKKDRKQFEALQLSKREVGKLYKIFKKVDVDGSGSIGLGELLAHIDVERTTFSQRVFSIFDEDGSGEIDFREFVLSLWNYCTLGRATLDLFAFDLYDRDSSGMLSLDEVESMLKDIYGKAFNSNFHARNIANDLRTIDCSGEIDAEQFCKFAKTHHALLFPAFEMQTALQRSTLGVAFWVKNSERRIEVSKGRFIPIAKFMELHLNRGLYHQTVTSAATVTAPVKDKAMLIMAITGTKNQRTENITGKTDEENKVGYAEHKNKVAVVRRKTKDEQALHERTKDFAQAHESIVAKTSAKVLSAKVSTVDPIQMTAAAKKRRASVGTIVPLTDDSAMTAATTDSARTHTNPGNDTAPKGTLSVKPAPKKSQNPVLNMPKDMEIDVAEAGNLLNQLPSMEAEARNKKLAKKEAREAKKSTAAK